MASVEKLKYDVVPSFGMSLLMMLVDKVPSAHWTLETRLKK